MILNLYVMNDSNNTINKSKELVTSVNIYFRKNIDLYTPRMLIGTIDFNKLQSNYCEIVDIKRFYFINNIDSINKNIWQLNCLCDVIETYKLDILNSKARFRRNIRSGDYYSTYLDSSINKNITKYYSNKSLDEGQSMILSTVGA